MLWLRKRFFNCRARRCSQSGPVILFGALLAASSWVFASGGPDSLGYRWHDSDGLGGPVYKWTEIRDSGTVLGNGDDDASWAVALPQPFWYYGASYASLHICSNGFISFTSTSTLSYAPFAGFPYPDQPNACLAPYWNDMKLDPSPHSGLYYYYDTIPRRFIVEWDSVKRFRGSLDSFRFSFQAVLDYSDSSILFFYRHANTYWQETDNGGYLASKVGIENQSGTVGLDVDWNLLHDGYAVRFFHLSDSDDVKAVAIVQPGKFLEPNSPISCQLQVTNVGLATETFPAQCTISRHDTLLFADTVTVSDLSPGDSVTVTFSTWTCGDPGEQYALTMCCAMDNDGVRANDSLSAQTVAFSYHDKLNSAWCTWPITIDGRLDPGEWPASARIDISDVLSIHGMAPPAGSAFLYAANDSSRLFLAVDVPYDNVLEDGDALFLYVDDDGNGTWASDSSEGQYQLTRTGAADSLTYTAFPGYDALSHGGLSYAAASSAGHVQYELSIPLGNSQPCFIANAPGGNCRLHCLWMNGADFGIYGWWPQVLEQYQDEDPLYYGTLALAGASGVGEHLQPLPAASLQLLPNAPNPFSGRTAISYQLPASGQVELGIYNVAGQLISTLISGFQQPGKHSATWNSAGVLAAGVYFYRLKFNGREQIGKMLLIK